MRTQITGIVVQDDDGRDHRYTGATRWEMDEGTLHVVAGQGMVIATFDERRWSRVQYTFG